MHEQVLSETATACMCAPPQQMHDGSLVVWRQQLLTCVEGLLKYLLSQLAFADKVSMS